MSEQPRGRDLLSEWRTAMESVISTIAAMAPGSEAGRQLLATMQRQTELLHQAVEQQQRIQRQLMDRAFQPVDAAFDIVEDAGGMLRSQAEALQQAAEAVARAAELVRMQAELFESATRTARRPSDALRTVAGATPRDPQERRRKR